MGVDQGNLGRRSGTTEINAGRGIGRRREATRSTKVGKADARQGGNSSENVFWLPSNDIMKEQKLDILAGQHSHKVTKTFYLYRETLHMYAYVCGNLWQMFPS